MPGAAAVTLRYAAFAALSTGVNIATQYVCARAYGGPFELYVAMMFGTGTGLVTKYLLDKQYIFFDRTRTLRGHSEKFVRYSLTGVATTAIFWATELAFAALGPQAWLRYAGAAVGLTIGYATKYRLDRRFVFRSEMP